jgi:hypothetical protein
MTYEKEDVCILSLWIIMFLIMLSGIIYDLVNGVYTGVTFVCTILCVFDGILIIGIYREMRWKEWNLKKHY